MSKGFENLGLIPQILDAISSQGFTEPSKIQQKAIPEILAKKDVLGLSQTGTGKTLAFVAPILQNMDEDRYPQAIILCPTRELAQQILVEVRKFAVNLPHIRAVAVYGGADMQRQIYNLKRGANIIVGTPGRVIDHINRRTIKLDAIKYVVLDEADEMLNMGFRPDMEEILSKTPQERQTTMFSATMSKDIKNLVTKFMQKPTEIQVGEQNATISTVKQTFFVTPKDKKKRALHSLLLELPRGRTIIFCNTKTMVDGVQSYLNKKGYEVLAIHGDMPQPVRKRVLSEYKEGLSDILVTTDVSARGIDVQDIMHVVNFDLPQNKEYYVHRVGRTGRAGKTGNAWTLLNTKEQIKDLQEIEKSTKSVITQGTLSLDGVAEVNVTRKPAKRGHNLNIKKREHKRIIGRNSGQAQLKPAVRSRYTKTNGVQIAENSKQKVIGRSRVTISSGAKRGTKTKTIRTVHKSKKIHF